MKKERKEYHAPKIESVLLNVDESVLETCKAGSQAGSGVIMNCKQSKCYDNNTS